MRIARLLLRLTNRVYVSVNRALMNRHIEVLRFNRVDDKVPIRGVNFGEGQIPSRKSRHSTTHNRIGS